jgi:hypothetical protein
MPTSAQGAVITVNGTAMNEVTEYSLQMLPGKAAPGNVGSLEVKALANNTVSATDYGRLRTVIVSHGGNVIARCAAIVEGITVDAVRNDVLRYTFTFRLAWIRRT